MTFKDIFKSSFLENSTSFSLLDMGIALLLALAVGLFILAVYKKTYKGVMYSQSFGVSLMALTLITTLVIKAVTSNVVLSLGMVGALSIVRFRTAIKEPLDEVDECKELYHNYLAELVTKYTTSGLFDVTVAQLDKLIAPYVEADATAFYAYSEYKASLVQLKTFAADRAASVLAQLFGNLETIETALDLTALGSNKGEKQPTMQQGDKEIEVAAGENIPQMDDREPPEGENMPAPEWQKQSEGNQMQGSTESYQEQIILIVICAISIIGGIIFVMGYRRKRITN